MSAMIKGVSAGMATGAAVYAYSNSKIGKKRNLKSRTAKAIHALGDIAEGLADFIS
jgi:pilus assembly protein TadC